MPFLLIRNDITNVSADVLVNPANEDLLEGSGTSRAVYLAAGEEKLADACRKIGHCDLGKAVITPAFDLKANYIIHAVGPVWIDGTYQEERILYQTYTEAMKLACQYEQESIAFPLLSSGDYGYPKDLAMKTAIHAISDFLLEHELLVYLVLYDRESVLISRHLIVGLEEYIEDHYVDEKNECIPGDENYSEYAKYEFLEKQLRSDRETAVKETQTDESEPYSVLDMTDESEPYSVSGMLDEPDLSVGRNFSCETESCVPKRPRSLEKLMEQKIETFSEMLLRLIDERGLKDSTVYKRANVDRRHFSKIRNDAAYAPTKRTVFAFAIALELSLDEASDLLRRAGYAFSDCSKEDVIIQYFISNKQYDMIEINEVLFFYGQKLLGE